MSLFWIMLSLVVVGFFLPGCVCCGSTCAIYSTTFSTNDLATNWTGGTIGSWSISGGVLSTSSTNAHLIATAQHPSGGQMVASTVVNGTSGDLVRIYAAWKDSSHYLVGEAKLGTSGYLKIFQKNGGGETLLCSVSQSNSTSIGMKLCVNYDESYVTFTEACTATLSSLPSGSTGAGLGTGGTVASAVTFDSFLCNRTDNGCGSCQLPCSACPGGGLGPAEIEVAVTGIQNIAPQTYCTQFNGNTYILQRSGDCTWDLFFPITPAIGEQQQVSASYAFNGITGLGNLNGAVGFITGLFPTTGGQQTYFNSTIGTGCSFPGIVLHWQLGGSDTFHCDGSASTITVTSL